MGGGWKKVQKQAVPFTDSLINPEFQKLRPSLFHIQHLKAKVAVCALPPRLAASVPNRLYQWKQHQFVQDDTFSQ